MPTKNTATKATTTNATTGNTVKKGQKAKTPAVVRPAIPNGYTGTPAALSAVKAGVKPSAYYPQGNAMLMLLPLPNNAPGKVQANHAAISGALKGNSGSLPTALANGATRRNVRQLYRAGYLVYKAQ